MSSDNSTLQPPNPLTPLAWVPPEISRNLSIKLYAEAGALAVLIWDILLHLPQDYKILTKFRISFMTIVFFFARLSTLAFVMGLVIVTTAPIGNCRLIRYIDFLYPFSIPFSILPFIPRVAAVYHNSRYVIAFFTLTWAVVLASSILWPFGVIGQQLGPTDYCVEMKLASTAAISALCLFIHDTLIFLATSWAFVLQSYMDESVKGVLKSIVLGKNLSGFTRSFLRDGQAYYMTSLLVHLLVLTQYFTASPFVFPCSLGNPSHVLLTCMSASVYRNTRLGYYRDYTMTSTTSHPPDLFIAFAKGPASQSSDVEIASDVHDQNPSRETPQQS